MPVFRHFGSPQIKNFKVCCTVGVKLDFVSNPSLQGMGVSIFGFYPSICGRLDLKFSELYQLCKRPFMFFLSLLGLCSLNIHDSVENLPLEKLLCTSI